MTPSLTPEQLSEFEARGVLRLPGLLPAPVVSAAREAVFASMERLGLRQGGAWSLDARPKPVWPDPGVHAKNIGNKLPEVAALIEPEGIVAVADVLTGGHACDRNVFNRPQVLTTLPNIDVWKLPQGWHLDSPRLPGHRSWGLQLFTFLTELMPGGGGTLVAAGSHRLVNDGKFRRSGSVTKALKREPFFRDLLGARFAWSPGYALPSGRVGDVDIEVVELTGQPGDAWFVDMGVLHAGAPNASAVPRIMVTHRYVRADLMAQVAGWKAPEAEADA